MSLNQRQTFMKTFIESQFGYCPLIWMLNGRIVNKKINHLDQRVLHIVYKDYISSFENLLKRYKSVTIHHRNIQSMAIELFKVKQNLSNSMLSNIFPTQSISYNLRSQTDFIRSNTSTSQYGLNSMRCFCIEGVVDDSDGNQKFSSYCKFQRKNQKVGASCYCKLCLSYIHNLGYVNLI